ncbi:hypothetical protein WJX72_000477 [[Myrmecia] bisecta]|uniref:Hydroxyproline O-arabinosyltransferase-like domain-containing protein n=1 Tax=[Myrmecia] bisecta TaxID=41462 RepID=A0AAW1Q2N9_9CHLO
MKPLRRSTRRLLILTAVGLVSVTSLNFLTDRFQHLPGLPDSSRRDSEEVQHFERRPRLEADGWDSAFHTQAELQEQQQQQRQFDEYTAKGNQQQKSPKVLQAASSLGQQADRNKYHVVVSSDARVYNEWQSRIAYLWYKKVKAQFPGNSMGGFTRLLHSGKPDRLMDELPTAVVNDLSDDVTHGYPVLARPSAFLQFVEQYLPSLPEDYILMCEPDHIFVRPPPLWASPTKPAAYPFTYIVPTDHRELLNRFNKRGVRIEDMAQIGNSPVMMHREQLREVVPLWSQLAMDLHNDGEANVTLGWILDMYAFSLASSQVAAGPIEFALHFDLMLQPPFEDKFNMPAAGGRPGCIIHYTYSQDFDEAGKFMWGKVLIFRYLLMQPCFTPLSYTYAPSQDTCAYLSVEGGVLAGTLADFSSPLHHHLPAALTQVNALCSISSATPITYEFNSSRLGNSGVSHHATQQGPIISFPYVPASSCPSGAESTFRTCNGAPYVTDAGAGLTGAQGALSVWFKWTTSGSLPSQAPLLAFIGPTAGQGGLRIYLGHSFPSAANDAITIVADTATNHYVYQYCGSSNVYQDGLWHQLALSCDGTSPGYALHVDTRSLPLTAVSASASALWFSSFGGAASVVLGGDIDKASGQQRYGGGFSVWSLKVYSQPVGACETGLAEYEGVRQAILQTDPTGFGSNFNSQSDAWWLYDPPSRAISVVRGTLLSATPQRYQAFSTITKPSGEQLTDAEACQDASQATYSRPAQCSSYGSMGPTFTCMLTATPPAPPSPPPPPPAPQTAFYGASTPSAIAQQEAAAKTVAATTVAASVTSSLVTSAVTTQVSTQMGIIGLGQQATTALGSSAMQVGIQPLIDSLQVFALQGHMPVTLSPTYATLASAVGWINFDINFGLGSKPEQHVRRMLAEQVDTHARGRSLQSLDAKTLQTQAETLSKAWNSQVWASAGARLFAIFLIGIIVVAVHALIYQLWRSVRFLNKRPLPQALVFPRIELMYLLATYIGMSEALGMLLGTGQVKGVVVGAIVLAYLALVTALLYLVLRKLIWRQKNFGLEYKIHDAAEGREERSCLGNCLYRCVHGEWDQEVGLDKTEPGRSQQYLASGFSLIHIARLLRRDQMSTVANNMVVPIDAFAFKTSQKAVPRLASSLKAGGTIAAGAAAPAGAACNALQFSRSAHWQALISGAERDSEACAEQLWPAGPVAEAMEKGGHVAWSDATKAGGSGAEGSNLLQPQGEGGEQADPELAATRIETMERFGGLFDAYRGTSFAAGCFLAMQMALKLLLSLVIGLGYGSRSQPGSAGGWGVCLSTLGLQFVYSCVLTWLRPQTDRIKWCTESLAAWLNTWAALCTVILQIDTFRVVQDLMLLAHLISLTFQVCSVWVLTAIQAAFAFAANSQAKAIIETLPDEVKARLQGMAWPSAETVWEAVRSVAEKAKPSSALSAVQLVGAVAPTAVAALAPSVNETEKERKKRLAKEEKAKKKAMNVVRATRPHELPDSLKNSPYRTPVSSSEPSMTTPKRSRPKQGSSMELGNRLMHLAQEREVEEEASKHNSSVKPFATE